MREALKYVSVHRCFLQVNELDPVCCDSNCIWVVSYLKYETTEIQFIKIWELIRLFGSTRLSSIYGFSNSTLQIPCVIRYWDHIEQTYVTYRLFFLSQSRSQTISLPNPLLDVEGTCQVASEEWQVVVDVALECESEKRYLL